MATMEKLITTLERCDPHARARVMSWFVGYCADEANQKKMLEAPPYEGKDPRQMDMFEDEASEKAAE